MQFRDAFFNLFGKQCQEINPSKRNLFADFCNQNAARDSAAAGHTISIAAEEVNPPLADNPFISTTIVRTIVVDG